jgi:hypothetical protein
MLDKAAHSSRNYKQLQFQKQFRLSMFLETTSGGFSAQVKHLHPLFPMHPIKLAT